jgi:hypothetical protein
MVLLRISARNGQYNACRNQKLRNTCFPFTDSVAKMSVHFMIRCCDCCFCHRNAAQKLPRGCVQPFKFTVGKPVSERKAKKTDGDSAGGSFSGLGGPRPPPALSLSVIGMKKGGKVRDLLICGIALQTSQIYVSDRLQV